PEERFDRTDDVHRADAGIVEHLGGLARTGHLAHREVAVAQIAEAAIREGRQHGVADPPLDPVILDDDDAPTSGARRIGESLRIDRLHGVEVDDPDGDVLMGQHVDRLHRFVHGYAGRDDRRAYFARSASDALAATAR